MIKDALLAYLHYIAIIVMFAFLTVQIVLLRRPIDAGAARLLARCDMWFGGASALILFTGLMRVFMGAKGSAFYAGNPVFWVKVGLFLVAGLVSIRPTIQFMRWSKQAAKDVGFVVEQAEQKRMRLYLMLEIHLLALVPLLAALMARGIGH